MSETHDKFESGCDFELDGPDKMSDLPIEDRLSAWMAWATYLKQRIKDHYRPRIAALEQELAIAKRLNSKWMDEKTAAVMRTVEADPHRSTTDSEMQKPPEGGFARPGRSPRRVQQGHYSQIAPCESIRRPSASATNCCRKTPTFA